MVRMNSSAERMLRSVVTVGRGFSRTLQQEGILCAFADEIIPADDPADAPEIIRRICPELVLVLQDAAPGRTIQFIRNVQTLSPETPVVVVSANPSVDDAVRSVRAGALDYIAGPLDRQTLVRLIDGMQIEKAATSRLRQRFFSDKCPPGVEIVGKSPGLVGCLEMIRLISESRCNPILIMGETGVGKELAARAVHWWRYGDFERFIAVNCATLTASLLESELFGHVKGAFTGADREKTGLFEQACDGSIFLDEISEMAPDLQAKLLRVLQERTFRKVGGTRDISCNATVIASSNKNLSTEAGDGRFRQDLYYRLAVFPITIPTLRQEGRRGDIPLLAEYFLLKSSQSIDKGGPLRLGKEAQRYLVKHDWPGNVRELRNVIERAIILENGGEIAVTSLVFDGDEGPVTPAQAQPREKPRKDFSLEAAEREFILRALQETGWQRTRAAALLGITRPTLYAKLKLYDIKAPEEKQKISSTPVDSPKETALPGSPAQ